MHKPDLFANTMSTAPLAHGAAAYLKTVAEAVQYAHQHGVLHRVHRAVLRVLGTNAGAQLGGSMVFSPDGRWLAATYYRPDILVWRTADWTPAWKVERDDDWGGLVFSPDSRLRAARCDKGEMRAARRAYERGVHVRSAGAPRPSRRAGLGLGSPAVSARQRRRPPRQLKIQTGPADGRSPPPAP